MSNVSACLFSRAEQGIEHRSRLVGRGKALVGFLAFEFNTEAAKKLTRGRPVKAPQKLSNTTSPRTAQRARIHDSMRSAASPAPGNEDLRGEKLRASEHEDFRTTASSPQRTNNAGSENAG